ncbi:Bud site selection protein 3 [Debaryomyces fabryi]|uniref:Bud site selection protein 3 n=1 Tax=Debaryomyces fabryi TaxID=58627 RepID=A0A0V1PVM1_9ASCO|nr:Bud site selection protein 3 [Debaryomyces fabryi]KSA00296.1 Bud site selection protein 3 [Debaryomyces fabryi]CUM49675.1 unnamed protein product [Debaryomyces fabryi]
MSVYNRYASGEYDKTHFEKANKSKDDDDKVGLIQISPLLGQFSTSDILHKFNEKNIEEWLAIFPKAAYFKGYDETLFGNVVIMVYENLHTGKLNTTSFSKFGVTSYDNLVLDARSRFWPSCENLLPTYQKSNVRRSLAITNLKNYNKLSNSPGNFDINKSWDETYAGNLANNMQLISEKRPEKFGLKLLELGLLQTHCIQSTVLDVIYDNSSSETSDKIIEENNKLVFLIGTQMEQLFDPLLEYSPEIMEFSYTVPTDTIPPKIKNNELINTIISELLTVQTNFTMGLVNLLQNFIIPLRIHVLAASSSSGITKINQVFPPTIDEITRINCILHDSLKKASAFGYVEIMKAIGTIMPYFYKAFIRHEANLKNFRNKLAKFHSKNEKKIFGNSMINKGNFGIRDIDSIVAGSLLELPKLKLILVRLKDSIISEKTKLTNFEDEPSDEFSTIERYFNSAIDVIDAFGFEEERNETQIDIRQRVFTPTGKILTELASKWPSELQYGWLARKVVGIYEMRNIKPFNNSFYDLDILIIFSDHILFLTIVDDAYYCERNNQSFKNLSVSDILMHSLVNDKPLPSLKLLPSMEVNCWCNINEVITTTYKGLSPITSKTQEFLKFVNISKTGFKNNNEDNCTISKSYEILDGSDRGNIDGCKIIELINKSTVLNKRKPFHLFKSNDPKLHVYSIAQELSAYQEETCKSPMALYLNLPIHNSKKYFEENQTVHFVLNASFINDHQIHIVGFNRADTFELNEIISSNDLQVCLKEAIVKNFSLLFNNFSNISKLLTQSYAYDVNYCANIFTQIDEIQLNKQRLEIAKNNHISSDSKLRTRNVSEIISIPEVHMTKILPSTTNAEEQNLQRRKTERVLVAESKNYSRDAEVKHSSQEISSKRNSIIRKVFKSIRRSFDGIENATPKVEVHESKISPSVQDNSSFSGKKNEYTSLYKPLPQLQTKEKKFTEVNNSEEIESRNDIQASRGCDSSVQQSRNTSGSLDVNSHFEFPPHTDSLSESNNNTIILVDESEKKHKKKPTEESILIVDSANLHLSNNTSRLANEDYGKFNVEDFYDDGEANWVSFSIDNYSQLNAEIRALKEEAHMDTEDVIELNDSSNTSEYEIPDEYESKGFEAFYTPQNQLVAQFGDNPTLLETNREMSTQSLASSEIIEVFGKQIDSNFRSEYIPSLNGNLNLINYNKTFVSQNDHRFSVLTSSEDEFFSSDDFASSLPPSNLMKSPTPSPIILNSSSSDATIINENLEEKLLPAIPVDYDNKTLVSSQIHESMHSPFARSDSISTTYESMTYLSEILNGNLSF